jgi:hypothetical protein
VEPEHQPPITGIGASEKTPTPLTSVTTKTDSLQPPRRCTFSTTGLIDRSRRRAGSVLFDRLSSMLLCACQTTRPGPRRFNTFAGRRLAMGWSVGRQGVKTWFDRESRRLKQLELSGSGRERIKRGQAGGYLKSLTPVRRQSATPEKNLSLVRGRLSPRPGRKSCGHMSRRPRSKLVARLKQMQPQEFENLAYGLVFLCGAQNLRWRTPGADGGRDLECEFRVADFSGEHATEKWYVECKRYGKSPALAQPLAALGTEFLRYPGLMAARRARSTGHNTYRVIVYSVHDSEDVQAYADNVRCRYILKGRPRELKSHIEATIDRAPHGWAGRRRSATRRNHPALPHSLR